MYAIGNLEYKVSLRSNKYIDVSKIAKYFGVAESTISYWASLGMPVAVIDGRKLYGKQSITNSLKSHEMPSQRQNKKPVTMGVVKD